MDGFAVVLECGELNDIVGFSHFAHNGSLPVVASVSVPVTTPRATSDLRRKRVTRLSFRIAQCCKEGGGIGNRGKVIAETGVILRSCRASWIATESPGMAAPSFAALASVDRLEELVDRLLPCGSPSTWKLLSTPLEFRNVSPPTA